MELIKRFGDRLALAEVHVEDAHDAGPVRPGLAVHQGRVLDGLEEVAGAQHPGAAGDLARSDGEVHQRQAQLRAGLHQLFADPVSVLEAQAQEGVVVPHIVPPGALAAFGGAEVELGQGALRDLPHN